MTVVSGRTPVGGVVVINVVDVVVLVLVVVAGANAAVVALV